MEAAILEGRLLLKGLDPDDPMIDALDYMFDLCEEVVEMI